LQLLGSMRSRGRSIRARWGHKRFIPGRGKEERAPNKKAAVKVWIKGNKRRAKLGGGGGGGGGVAGGGGGRCSLISGKRIEEKGGANTGGSGGVGYRNKGKGEGWVKKGDDHIQRRGQLT